MKIEKTIQAQTKIPPAVKARQVDIDARKALENLYW